MLSHADVLTSIHQCTYAPTQSYMKHQLVRKLISKSSDRGMGSWGDQYMLQERLDISVDGYRVEHFLDKDFAV